jgi:plastocyanin
VVRTFLAAVVAALALAAPPAMAVDTTVRVGDDFFDPADIQIDPGDTVTWEWVGIYGNHSVTSRPNQTESFDSDPGNNNPQHAPGSTPFTHTFNQVGMTRYYCKLHPSTMNGTVTVGTPPADTAAPGVDPSKPRVGRRTVRVAFELTEAGLVELTVARAARPGRNLRSVERQLEAGNHSLSFRRGRLRPGRYLAKLTARDAAGNQSEIESASFRLRRPRR